MGLITIKEVCEMLKIKQSTAYQWAEMGKLPCYKLNGAVRFKTEEIEVWVDSCKWEPDRVSLNISGRKPLKGGDA